MINNKFDRAKIVSYLILIQIFNQLFLKLYFCYMLSIVLQYVISKNIFRAIAIYYKLV